MMMSPAMTYTRFTESLCVIVAGAVLFSSIDTLRGVIIASPLLEDDSSPGTWLLSSDFFVWSVLSSTRDSVSQLSLLTSWPVTGCRLRDTSSGLRIFLKLTSLQADKLTSSNILTSLFFQFFFTCPVKWVHFFNSGCASWLACWVC